MIYKLASSFSTSSVDDLFQVGVIGLINAYNNYNPSYGTKFSTYAYKYIYGEIYNYINNYKNIKVSKDYIKLYKKINTARSILAQELMKEPTTYELSSFLEIDPYIIDTVNNSMTKIDSLDRVLYNDGKEITIFDTISDNKDYYNIDYLLLNEEIDKLESPYKELIYLRYFEDKTQSEVASLLGMNQVEVSRTEKKTLKRIRNNYQNVA